MENINNTILIIENNISDYNALNDMLSSYKILHAEDEITAIDAITNNNIDLIILSLTAPILDIYSFLETIKFEFPKKKIPIVVISSSDQNSTGIEIIFKNNWVVDFISKPLNNVIIVNKIKHIISSMHKQSEIISYTVGQIYNNLHNSKLMAQILSHIVESRNYESGAHVLHINTLTKLLLLELSKLTDKYNLSKESIELITIASSFHDIGKMWLSEEILNKPGKLTEEEFEQVKLHTIYGYKCLMTLNGCEDLLLLKYIKDICRWHHEKWDGNGYPDHLAGDAIPIWAQVVSIADCYDALTSERCYKEAYSPEVAIAMICNGECGQFNQDLLEALVAIKNKISGELKSDFSEISKEEIFETITLILNKDSEK